jgi:hypothetical protein
VSEAFAGSVDVPGAGRVKKAYLFVPAGVAAAYVAYRWYSSRQQANQAPPGADGLYGSADLTDMGLSTTGGPTTVTGNTGNQTTDGTTPGAIDDNAEWTQAAVERLTQQGWDGQAVQAALGEFLAKRALDKTEASIARAALAVAGQPPIGGPYSVIEEAGTATGTLAAPANVRAYGAVTTSQIGLQWAPVPGASHYEIYSTSAAYGTENIGSSLDTVFYARGLKPNTAYGFYVVAVGTTGKKSPKSGTYSAKTLPVKLPAPTGLWSGNGTRTSFRVGCKPVTGATYYRWYLNGQQVGNSDRWYRDFTGLKPNTAYKVQVAADTTNQAQGPLSAPITVRTKK